MINLSKDIINEWGMSSMSEEEQKSALENIGKMIFQALLVKSLDILSDKEEEELDALLDKDTTTTQDVLSFLKRKIPTFERLVKEEKNNVKQSLLAGTT